ncbi:hypothetical protein AMATHDRAFT_53331 [Amanita thiersii Skay4041]|uniref:Ribosomal protein S21 n=1 Tax=Amanita thiersii Skay4041 TaxID=703135 RepID=A0A2A9P098_9AGAR|nr:hypothetical protein AMATHDRAFT_53331 [Amanita thiersii Skay4041]
MLSFVAASLFKPAASWAVRYSYTRPVSNTLTRLNSTASRQRPFIDASQAIQGFTNVPAPHKAARPLTADGEWARMAKELAKNEPLVANPFSGRTVRVVNNNLADAFRKLDGIIGRNKVRAQLKQSERHEQKGAKRRRLSSERWRKRFSHEVRLKVQLVEKIRRRGA